MRFVRVLSISLLFALSYPSLNLEAQTDDVKRLLVEAPRDIPLAAADHRKL